MEEKYFLLFLSGKTTIVRELNGIADAMRPPHCTTVGERIFDREVVEGLRTFGAGASVGEMFSVNGELIVVRLAARTYDLTEVRW
jgi:hypothetical protein